MRVFVGHQNLARYKWQVLLFCGWVTLIESWGQTLIWCSLPWWMMAMPCSCLENSSEGCRSTRLLTEICVMTVISVISTSSSHVQVRFCCMILSFLTISTAWGLLTSLFGRPLALCRSASVLKSIEILWLLILKLRGLWSLILFNSLVLCEQVFSRGENEWLYKIEPCRGRQGKELFYLGQSWELILDLATASQTIQGSKNMPESTNELLFDWLWEKEIVWIHFLEGYVCWDWCMCCVVICGVWQIIDEAWALQPMFLLIFSGILVSYDLSWMWTVCCRLVRCKMVHVPFFATSSNW